MNITIIKNKNILDYENWKIWECAPSQFDWTYSEEEHCFIIKGEIVVLYADQKINISPGDYVIFPKGLKCYWKVLEPVKKYYTFK